ncbi:MAG TPA: dethiobiotin synthase [Kiritimatiellia bacterium]|nr:dethiobiotin synthase [Kiritimatiellia bacterium]HRZ13194.1 dethiobiotin synthase [Kiritimatiellia bacterium]HSA19761.1 dethiobiotin synthase [Kiritimatiellia bacterium]
MKGLFITGTDTGIGKTAVLAALLCALRRAGIDAAPMKPVQTGCRPSRRGLVSPDLERALRAAGLRPDAAEKSLMCPYPFRPACSPHLAAAQAGVRIRLSAIRKAFRRLSARHSYVLVEGAGGVLVPLNGNKTMLDLMRALALPVIVAARPGLGTLNHTLMTLRELRRAGLKILGVILVCARRAPWGAIERSNLETIRRLGRVPAHRLRYRRGPGAPGDAVRWIKEWNLRASRRA